jgi:hypothetical protein
MEPPGQRSARVLEKYFKWSDFLSSDMHRPPMLFSMALWICASNKFEGECREKMTYRTVSDC